LAGLALTLFVFFAMRAKSTVWLKAGGALVLAVILTLWACWGEVRPMIHDSGRFAVWAQTVDDWKGPCIKMAIPEGASMAQKKEIENLNKRNYAMTGRGLGSFQFIFGPKFNSVFDSAHCVYLDTLYEIGLIGLGLLLATIWFVLRGAFALARQDKFVRALFVSFIFILFAGCFASILKLEPLRYFSVGVFCLLSSLVVNRKTNCIF
jgi:hypothetical protein